jgi:FdhD protein
LRPLDDYLGGEEPLEIRVGDAALSVTMRTPGHDLELATGFLFTEGLISGWNQIASVRHESDARQNGTNRVRVDLASGVTLDSEASRRNFYTTSSCGVCGKASIDAVRVRGIEPPNPECTLDPQVLCGLPDQLRAAQQIFNRTGSLHAAASSAWAVSCSFSVKMSEGTTQWTRWLAGRWPTTACRLATHC